MELGEDEYWPVAFEADELWLDENVTRYAGNIPAFITYQEAVRECGGCEEMFAAFIAKFGNQTHYRAKSVFQWLGY